MLMEKELKKLTGPVLRDGTSLRDLINFEKHEVAMRVLNDPEIHRLELKRIFSRQWIGLGHTSEIPNPGDFVKRYHGEDPVIVTRDDNGEINVLLNVCAHRGMELCWADEGTSRLFRCPYHGWTYDGTGRLRGAPYERTMYGDWDKSQLGLRRARVAVRHGLIWGTFDDETPSFEDWLGDAKFYYDYLMGSNEWESNGGRSRYVVHANWKVAADQFMGDGYHVATLHQSMHDVGTDVARLIRDGELKQEGRKQVRVAGHQQGETEVERAALSADPMGRENRNLVKASVPQAHGIWVFGAQKFSPERPKDLKTMPGFVLWMNPASRVSNSGSGGGWREAPNGEGFLTVQLNTLIPRGPDKFEMWAVQLVPKGLPDHLKDWHARADAIEQSFNSDDVTGWPMVQRPLSGAMAQEAPMRYFNLKGEFKPDGFPGPGTVHGSPGTSSGDDSQWRFWERWFEMMTDDEGAR